MGGTKDMVAVTTEQWERIIQRQGLTRRDLLTIGIFARSRPEMSMVRAVYEFLRGRGPAAVARGRAGQDMLVHPKWRVQVAPATCDTPSIADAVVTWTEIKPRTSAPSQGTHVAALR